MRLSGMLSAGVATESAGDGGSCLTGLSDACLDLGLVSLLAVVDLLVLAEGLWVATPAFFGRFLVKSFVETTLVWPPNIANLSSLVSSGPMSI